MDLVFPTPALKILVVDDDGDSRDALTRFLEKAGHSVISAKDGHDALALLGSSIPDLVVVDYRMPDMDGVTLLKVLRSYLRWADVPVAILTAYPDEPRLWQVQDLGVDRIFTKSKFRLDELLAYIEQRVQPRVAPEVFDDRSPPSAGV